MQQYSQEVEKQDLLENFRKSGIWKKFKTNILSKQGISQCINLENSTHMTLNHPHVKKRKLGVEKKRKREKEREKQDIAATLDPRVA